MQCRLVTILLLIAAALRGVVIDRIAIVVGDSIIKDSDIERDLRTTEFLNGQPLNLSQSERKTAANRLIDQVLIRREVRIGDYPRATMEQAEQELAGLEKERFHNQAGLQASLKRYGLTELQLRESFQWQLTVLRFIEARFKPAVFISEEAVQNYYNQHVSELRKEHANSSLDALGGEIRDTLSEEQVNKLFFAWLDQRRGEEKIQYLEGGLR